MMRRQSDDTEALVYAYGCADPVMGGDAAEQEVERRRAFWDVLVGIDRLYDREVQAAACAADPIIGECIAGIESLSADLDAVFERRRGERAKARAKIDTPELDAQIRDLIARRRLLYRARNERLAAWRKAHKAEADAIERTRRARQKTARQESGLYWCNYNAALDAFNAARLTCRKKGRRVRYSDPARDDGCLDIQIQRTKTGLGAAPGELMDGTVSAIQIGHVDPRAWDPDTFRGDRRRLCKTAVDVRVDAAGNIIRLPVWIHRPLPEGARIKKAQLVWQREGGHRRWKLCLTVSQLASAVVHGSGAACGVDLGWRLCPDGSLLVATLIDTTGETRRYYLDARWMRRMERVEALHSHIDDLLITLARDIQEGLRVPAAVAEACARWRPGLGARHIDATALDEAVLALGDRAGERLHQWRRRYRRGLLERDHLRAKLLRQRREIYRLIAREIATRYALIGLEDMDLSQMARTRRREDGSDPELHAAARSQRVRACVHVLRSEIRHQSHKHGAEVALIAGASTMLCHECHGVTGQGDRAAVHWRCEHCGAVWDVDINAARNILATAIGDASSDAVRRVG